MGVIWWIYGIGLKGPAPSWQVEEVNYRRRSASPRGQLERRQLAGPDDAARPRRSHRRRPDDRRRRPRSTCRPTSAEAGGEHHRRAPDPRGVRGSPRSCDIERRARPAGRCCRSSDRQPGEAAATADGVPRRRDGRALRARVQPTTCRSTSSDRRQGAARRRLDCSAAHRVQARGSPCTSGTRPHYAVVQVQAGRAAGDGPGRGAAAPAGRPGRSRSSRWSWSATRATCGFPGRLFTIVLRDRCSRVTP